MLFHLNSAATQAERGLCATSSLPIRYPSDAMPWPRRLPAEQVLDPSKGDDGESVSMDVCIVYSGCTPSVHQAGPALSDRPSHAPRTILVCTSKNVQPRTPRPGPTSSVGVILRVLVPRALQRRWRQVPSVMPRMTFAFDFPSSALVPLFPYSVLRIDCCVFKLLSTWPLTDVAHFSFLQ